MHSKLVNTGPFPGFNLYGSAVLDNVLQMILNKQYSFSWRMHKLSLKLIGNRSSNRKKYTVLILADSQLRHVNAVENGTVISITKSSSVI